MTRYFLSRVKVEGFRGINNEADPLVLDFKPEAVNSVFSINGVGKSSIFEALHYAIRGTIPKLDELQAQEKPEDYFCNLFHSQGKATIEIELIPDDDLTSKVVINVQRDASGNRVVTSPSGCKDPEDLLASLNEDFALLDYSTFVRFIDSSPLERGRSFSSLLGLSAYSDFGQMLQFVSDTRVLNSDFNINTLKAQTKSNEDAEQIATRRLQLSYNALTGKDLTDISEIDKCAAEVVAALSNIDLIKGSVDGKSLAQIDFQEVKDKIKESEGGEKRKKLEKAVEIITVLKGLEQPESNKNSAEQESILQLLKDKDTLLEATKGDSFKQLYNAAKELIDRNEWEESQKCPLCESELNINIENLIQQQLDQYGQVILKSAEIKKRWEEATWVAQLQSLEQENKLDINPEYRISFPLSQKATSGELVASDVEHAINVLETLEAKREILLDEEEVCKDELEKELPPSLVSLTEQVEHGRQFAESFEEYKEKEKQKTAAKSNIHVRERWREFINNASSIFATAESDLSRKKINDIDTDYKTMFNTIMGIKDVVPELQRAEQREDLHVQLSSFHGQSDVSARALLSESYRNALAISVFLSAALKQTGAPRFVVLDDVTSSFDSGHQWNLMEQIRLNLQQPKNADGVQFVILSHDGLLEKYFDKLGNTSDWHHQKLQGWPPRGAVMSQTQDANRLRGTAIRLLNAGQVKEAEPLIRQYLEFKLLQIISKVRIPVPLDFAIKDHMKMVSNCLDAINAAIELNRKAGTLVLETQQQNDLDNVHVPALVGNWASHYETASGSSVAPPVLIGVLDTIDQVADCFKFDDNRGTTTIRSWYRSLSAKT